MSTHLVLMAAELPQWFVEWMDPLRYALGVVLLLWFLSLWFRAEQRRRFGLSPMETTEAPKGEKTPAFLKVDHAARDAAIQRGDDYRRPGEDAAPAVVAPRGRYNKLWVTIRVVSVLLALVNLGVAVAGCLAVATEPGEEFGKLSASERWSVIFNRYWIALMVALVLLAVELFRFLRTRGAQEARPS